MNLTVEYFAQARAVAGVAMDGVSLSSPATLRDLIAELVRRHGPKLESLLLPGGELSRTVIFAVGESQVPPGENIKLSDGDHVVIIPPISGGRR